MSIQGSWQLVIIANVSPAAIAPKVDILSKADYTLETMTSLALDRQAIATGLSQRIQSASELRRYAASGFEYRDEGKLQSDL